MFYCLLSVILKFYLLIALCILKYFGIYVYLWNTMRSATDKSNKWFLLTNEVEFYPKWYFIDVSTKFKMLIYTLFLNDENINKKINLTTCGHDMLTYEHYFI